MSKIAFIKEYFNLTELAEYSGLGKRFIRDAIKDENNPLPSFPINKKTILVSRDDFMQWLEHFKFNNHNNLNNIVDQVIIDLSNK